MSVELNWLPLSEVAEDARPLVQAFREAGALHYGHFPPDQSRANFVRACELNGLGGIDCVVHRDIMVAVTGGEIRVRLYGAEDANNAEAKPLIVFIHGGGWVIGSVETHDGICRLLAQRSGCTVASIDYRCAPEHRWPVPLEDCEQALAHLVVNAEALSIDASRVVLAGDSAGSNMATIIANAPPIGPYAVVGQVLLYPVTDLAEERASYQRFQEGFPLVAESMRWFRDQYVAQGVPLDQPRLSPLRHAHGKRQPPMFIVTVGMDPLCDEGIEYANCAARAGGLVEHHHLPGHMHGIFTAAARIPTARELLAQAAAFVRRLDCTSR